MRLVSGIMGEPKNCSRKFWIDVIKMIAIIMVIHAHVMGVVEPDYMNAITFSQEFTSANRVVANLGVPLFVMVSGALLFGKQFASKSDILSFYRRSLLPLVITAEVWIVIYSLSTLRPYSIKELLLCMTLVHKPEVHLWYVRIIVIYYLAVPLFNILRSKSKYIYTIIFVAVVILSFVYNGWLIMRGNPCPTTPARSYLCYFAYMAIGYQLSIIEISYIRIIIASVMFLLCGGGAILSLMYTHYFLWYDNPLLAVAAGGLFYVIRALFRYMDGSSGLNKSLSEISKMSYGIYLSHFMLIYVWGVWKNVHGVSMMTVYVALSLLFFFCVFLIYMTKQKLPRMSIIVFRY